MQHKLTIRLDSRGCGKILLDGNEIKGVTAIHIIASADRMPIVTLELVRTEVEFDFENALVTGCVGHPVEKTPNEQA